MGHFAFLTGVVALACGHLARSAIVSNGSLSAIPEAIEERTFLEPIAASFFADHSSTQVRISKRSLTIRDSSTNFTGNVALQNAGSMYYAARDFRRGFGQQYARFDVKGDGKKKVLQTEEFRDVIGEVVCHDGKIGLSFTQDIDFQQIKHEWQWTNEDDGHAVILVTETYDCDRNKTDGTTRQPWLVSEIAFDDGQCHVELSAEAVSFQEAFGLAWHVSIARDTVSIPHITRDTHPGQISLNSNFSGMNMNLPPSLALNPISANAKPMGMVSCDPCYTTGEFDFRIDIDGLSGGKLHVTTRDIEASITLRLDIYEALAAKTSNDHEIWGFVPPGAGIYIKNILDIGPTFKFLVSTSFTTPVDEELALALGYKVTMAGLMDFVWDTDNPTGKLTGFNPEFETLAPGISKDVELVARIGPKLELSLDWLVLNQGGKVGFTFAAGTLSMNVSTDNRAVPCDGKGTNAIPLTQAQDSDNDTLRGVNLDLKLDQEILAFQSLHLPGKKASHTQTLASTSYDVFSACIPITGATLLTPRIATASVHSYTPHIGDLTDWVQPAKLVAQEVAQAFTALGGAAVESLTAVVLPQVTAAVATLTSEAVASVVTVAAAAAEPAREMTSEAGNVAHEISHGFCGIWGC